MTLSNINALNFFAAKAQINGRYDYNVCIHKNICNFGYLFISQIFFDQKLELIVKLYLNHNYLFIIDIWIRIYLNPLYFLTIYAPTFPRSKLCSVFTPSPSDPIFLHPMFLLQVRISPQRQVSIKSNWFTTLVGGLCVVLEVWENP